ncbi:hypothetical protein NE237_026473 [Protea cynaroides]|uniref:F-box associated beta-propeller type 1 domain-containing protein n=1 Tax=Protea cynaroides TaxID=273540 RepID=A0A9Q0H3T4_9MAGN|nr:hypothetical protein NE237_026473 [Protea cynaroides]
MALDNIIFEVFSRLPVKAIFRFKAISKSCSSLPSEAFFMMQQSLQLQFMDDDGFFIQPESCSSNVELHALSEKNTIKGNKNGKKQSSDFGVPDNSLQFLKEKARILSSSNGLIVCLNREEEDMDLFLCNPATQNWFLLPNSPESNGFKNSSYMMGAHVVFNNQIKFPDDYRVIAVESVNEEWPSHTTCSIYSAKDQAWKEMGRFYTGNRDMRWDMPVYNDGVVYLISDSFPYLHRESPFYKPYIVAYDMEKGISRFLRLPREGKRGSDDPSCDMRIFRWGKLGESSPASSSLCVIRLRRSVFMGWVLQDYDDRAWTRVLKVHVRAMRLVDPNPIICGFTVMNGNLLVFATEERVYQCRLALGAPTDPNGSYGEHLVQVEEICRHGLGSSRKLKLNAYASTLRPCGSGETPYPSN